MAISIGSAQSGPPVFLYIILLLLVAGLVYFFVYRKKRKTSNKKRAVRQEEYSESSSGFGGFFIFIIFLIVIVLVWGFIGGSITQDIGYTCDTGAGKSLCWFWHQNAIGQAQEYVQDTAGKIADFFGK